MNIYGSYSCFCKTSFYGKNCETFDPCRSMPCINGGTCMSNETYPYWQCTCSGFYTGKTDIIITIIIEIFLFQVRIVKQRYSVVRQILVEQELVKIFPMVIIDAYVHRLLPVDLVIFHYYHVIPIHV